MTNREIEVKFLEIDKPKLMDNLTRLGALDLGEEKITEQIFHDPEGRWYEERKFGRIRTTSKGITFTYKHVEQRIATGTVEIEFKITEADKMKAFLEISASRLLVHSGIVLFAVVSISLSLFSVNFRQFGVKSLLLV